MTLLQTVNQRAGDLDLSFKPVKCISYLFDGSKCLQKRIPLSKGVTRLITEGGTKILGKLIDTLLSTNKRAANKHMISQLKNCYLLLMLCTSVESINYWSIRTISFHCCISIFVLMLSHLYCYFKDGVYGRTLFEKNG